jgi:hypothetical protein
MAVVEERAPKKPRQPRKPRNARITQKLAQEIPKTNKQLKQMGTTVAKNQNNLGQALAKSTNSSLATVAAILTEGENPKKKGSREGKKHTKGEAEGPKRKDPERKRQTMNKADGCGTLADVAAKRRAKYEAEGS